MQTGPLPPPSLTRDLVLVGGGHAHALVLKRWGMAPLPGARVTLIHPGASAPYTGMLPGHAAGHYARDELEIDLVRLARFAGARLVSGMAQGIDAQAGLVQVTGRAPVCFDVLSLDIGITGAVPDVAGTQYILPAKPLDAFAARWAEFIQAVEAGEARPEVCVIGAGAAGVELALAAAHRLKTAGALDPVISLIEARAHITADLPAGPRRALMRALEKAGVRVITGATVASVSAEAVALNDGTRLPSALTLSAAGARPHDWLGETGLALHEGYVAVDAHLRSLSHPNIFASGDCAHLTHAPRPKAGVYAVRAAPVLARNLEAVLRGTGKLERFRPQGDYLRLISLGGQRALAARNGVSASGGWVWRWKDRIDREFMKSLSDLPVMTPPPLPARAAAGRDADAPPLCGGCGAKAGRAALARALSSLPAPIRSDLLAGPGDDAAVLVHGTGVQVITTDHVRAFTEDHGLLARIAAVHALGDVWAMGAAPQAALVQIILPSMSPALQASTLTEILAEAGDVLRAAGAELAGGHTSIGAELTIGFTITGLADTPVRQSGARAGDVLILTKPIGTGVILAAEMRQAARGRDVMTALEMMARPQGRAAAILAPAARAMTDVTGFGLAGHLASLLGPEGPGAEIALDALPVLPGALELAGAGVRSSLFEDNQAGAGPVDAPEGAARDLLFDPQTAGGLLATIPAAHANAVLAALHDAGEPAWRIGVVSDEFEGIRVR
ncbi:MAG: selenide, water dikinase SelD [Oceanicaulis sp.]|nr:selenide, water dikinase SelD [Oceanicaulis sp.]